MPEYNDFSEKSTAESFAQTVKTDERLKLVKVVNLNGRTFIKGTDQTQVTVRTTSRNNLGASPLIEVKNNGREVEVRATPPGVSFGISLDDNDPDMGDWGRFEDFDAGDEPEPPEKPWNFSDPTAREGYYRQREEYYRRRDDYRRNRDEQRHKRQEEKEARRAAKEQLREAMRQQRRGWFNFDVEALSQVATTIGKTVGDVFGSLGDLYVEVPAGVELEVRSVSGVIEVSDMGGFCRVSNTSGFINLTNLTGGVQLKGLSGKVLGRGLVGAVTAKVTGGNISLINSRLTALDLSINGGNASIETALAEPYEDDFKISNSGGNIRLTLPRSAKASIEARTLSGRISMPPGIGPVEYRNRPGQNQSRFELNGGGRKVTINSMSGNVVVDLYEVPSENFDYAAPPPPPASWPKPPPPPSPATPVMQNVPTVPPVPPAPPEINPLGPTYQPPSAPQTLITPPPMTYWPDAQEVETSERREQSQDKTAEKETAKEAAKEVGQHEEAVATAPKADDTRKLGQLEILRLIERGELSVEDGLARLNELEN